MGSRRGQGYMMSSSQGLAIVAIAALAFLAPSVSAQDNKNCTFGPGICPVTKENVVDVFYFDVVDDFSCQQHCLDLDECHFFTMYGVKDTPKDHMKCFMFKTCDHLEPCPECTTGPDHPPMPHPLPPCDPRITSARRNARTFWTWTTSTPRTTSLARFSVTWR